LTSLRNRELVYRHEESEFEGSVEYLFKHDVLREVTYESVVKRLRKTYHGLVADWLIANGGDRIGEYSGLIADHLLIAEREKQACEYFRQAGETALDSYANAEAEIFYRQAMELSPQDSLRADLLTGVGEALWRQGNYEEAKLSWKMAIKIYRDNGNSDRTAEVYARLSELLWDWEGYEFAWNVCQEGLEAIEGAPDSSGYARLLAEAGRMAFMRNLTDEIRPLCQQAYEMAERVGELEVVADTRITLALIEEDITEAVTEMEEVADFAEKHGILHSAARAYLNLGFFMGVYLIDFHLGEQHTLQSIEIFNQIGDIGTLGMLYGNVCESMIEMGQLNQAEQLINEFFSGPPLPGTRNAYYFQRIRALLLFTRGEWDQAKETNHMLREEIRQGTFLQSIAGRNFDLAMAIIESNRFELMDDLSMAESALKENIEIGGTLSLDSKFLMVEVYIHQGRISAAQDQFAQAQDGISPAVRGNNLFRVLRANAEIELALAEDRWDKAIEASSSSIEIYKNCGHRWGWARRLIDLGDALVGRDEPGDMQHAKETYQQSLDMFTEMGAPGYIKVLQERLGD
jgi:tetratricopeptide (TPR) repeat protein